MQFWGTYQGFRQSGPLNWQLRQTFLLPARLPSAGSNPAPRQVEPIQYNEVVEKAMMKIAALVPIRHHSQRVPGKNYRIIGWKTALPSYH
jgi:hypothetical protein